MEIPLNIMDFSYCLGPFLSPGPINRLLQKWGNCFTATSLKLCCAITALCWCAQAKFLTGTRPDFSGASAGLSCPSPISWTCADHCLLLSCTLLLCPCLCCPCMGSCHISVTTRSQSQQTTLLTASYCSQGFAFSFALLPIRWEQKAVITFLWFWRIVFPFQN